MSVIKPMFTKIFVNFFILLDLLFNPDFSLRPVRRKIYMAIANNAKTTTWLNKSSCFWTYETLRQKVSMDLRLLFDEKFRNMSE